ncbi:MAG: efflux RND transporter periplasmic adaptor subunit [Planctomycetes bacterium]|nr:efflux RND transporter periplasmic adaptor subunit [Planctomycetota bacterium]
MRLIPRVVLLAVLLSVPACGRPESKATAKVSPAKVEKLPGEADLVTITLTAEAAERLGIATAAMKRETVAGSRAFGGEVVLPPGAALGVMAPFAGIIGAGSEVTPPRPGARMNAGQTVFELAPLLAPESAVTFKKALADSRGQVAQAEVQRAAAQVASDRAVALQRDGAGSRRAVEEAKAALDLAEATLAASTDAAEALEAAMTELDAGAASPIAIRCPIDATLIGLHVATGQSVAAGAPLFEVARAEAVWVRVPVYVGELDEVARDLAAEIGGLTPRAGSSTRTATPVEAPPTANAAATTADLYYALDNADGALRPGQRVGVTLPLTGAGESLIVPWSAVVHDINGGTWVYEQTAPLSFVRRRIEVRRVVADTAILRRGPQPGALVVTAGAAELFGTEFGGGK